MANVVGLLVLVVMIFPIYWMINTAFKPASDTLTYTPQFFPVHPTLHNFAQALSRPYFWSSVLNSVIVVGCTVVFALVVAFLAAVAVARFRFYGQRAFLIVILAVQMIPLTALIIPIYVMLAKVNQVNTLLGVIITYLTFVLPYSVWMLRGFVEGVPRDLEESAMIDGCSRFGAMVRILVPLVAPGLVAASIYAAIQAWNEYVMAYILLSDQSKETVTVWLAGFTTSHGTAYGPLMASATLIALPIVIFFMVVQHRIAEGLTAGAVKG